MKIPDSLASKPEAARVLSILEGLDKNAPGAEVFEAFEQLDDMPADIVRAVLTTWTGPAPDAALLEPALRKAHGLPALPLALRCARVVRPTSAAELGKVAQSQVRQAGLAWDGRDLSADLRLAKDGSESSFLGTLELKTFVDAAGKPRFDVALHGAASEASGAIFTAGQSTVLGAVAYGIVELTDRAARMGLQAVLTAEPDPTAAALAVAIAEPTAAEVSIEPMPDSIAETPRVVALRQLPLFGEQEPETKRFDRPAKKKTAAASKKVVAATKKSAASSKKTSPKAAAPASKKTTAKAAAPASKKTTAKAAAPASKKTTAKAAAPASKKTTAKETSKKTTAKAAAPASKKTATAPKKASASAPASKKASASAPASKKASASAPAPASKKASASAPASKKASASAPASKKAAPASKKAAPASKKAAPASKKAAPVSKKAAAAKPAADDAPAVSRRATKKRTT